MLKEATAFGVLCRSTRRLRSSPRQQMRRLATEQVSTALSASLGISDSSHYGLVSLSISVHLEPDPELKRCNLAPGAPVWGLSRMLLMLAGAQVKKYGAEAADKISHISAQGAEAGKAESGAAGGVDQLKKEVCFDPFRPIKPIYSEQCNSYFPEAAEPGGGKTQFNSQHMASDRASAILWYMHTKLWLHSVH